MWFQDKIKHLLIHDNQCMTWISSSIICKLRSITFNKIKLCYSSFPVLSFIEYNFSYLQEFRILEFMALKTYKLQ